MPEEKLKTGYPSIDRPWLKYYPAEATHASVPEKSAFEFVHENRKGSPNDVALEFFGVKIKYNTLFFNIEAAAKSLLALGVKRGDIVTLALPMIPEMVYIFYALNRIGAISNAIDPRLKTDEFANQIRLTNSKFLFTIDMCVPVAEEVMEQTAIESVIIISPIESLPFYIRAISKIKSNNKREKENKFLTWKNFLSKGKSFSGCIDAPYLPNSPITIVHTGGTTGVPKGVVLTNENFNVMALTQKISGYDVKEGDRFLTFLPPFTAYCLVNAIHDPLFLGFRNVLIPTFTPQDFPKLMMKYQPNHVLAGPILWDYFITSELTQKSDLSFIKSPISGGDVLNIELEERINDFFAAHGCTHKIAQGYGMTEVAAAACYSTDASYQLGSVGIPYVKNIVSAFDPDTGEELPYDHQGEICIQSPTMMLEYYHNATATSEVIKYHADGTVWVHTGDIGRVNSNGNIFIDGRLKRMIVRSGNKIFPSSVEAIISSVSDIENCVVVQMPNPIECHVPIAHIILKQGCDVGKAIQEADRLIKNKLPNFNVPYLYVIRSTFPLTKIHKIDYKAIEKESLQYAEEKSHFIVQ